MTRIQTMSGRRQLALGAIAALLLGLSLHHFVVSAGAAIGRGVVDFPIFLRNAEVFLETGRLYPHADHLPAYAPASPVYKFPPLYALFLLPVVRHGIPEGVYVVHWALQILLYLAATAVGMLALRGARAGPLLFACALLALNFEPFFETLWRLQIETPLLLLFALFVWALRRGRDGPAGVALGLCAMLKIYPGFLVLYLLARRRWRAILYCLATMLVIQAITILVFGVHENQIYFFRILPSMLGETSVISTENLGLGRYLQEFVGVGPWVAKRAGQVVTLLFVGAAFWVVERNRRAGRGVEWTALEFSLFASLMVFSLPNSWVNYQLTLLLPYFALIAWASRGARSARWVWAAVVAGSFLLLFYAPCADPRIVDWPCAETPRFLGLVALPRVFHDRMVEFRILATLVPLVTSLVLLARIPLAEAGDATRLAQR